MNQQEHFEHIHSLRRKLEDTYLDYWQQYSTIHTWQFWVVLANGYYSTSCFVFQN